MVTGSPPGGRTSCSPESLVAEDLEPAGVGSATAAREHDERLAVGPQRHRRRRRGHGEQLPAALVGHTPRRPVRGPRPPAARWCRALPSVAWRARSRGSPPGSRRCGVPRGCPSLRACRARGVRPARASTRRAVGCAAASGCSSRSRRTAPGAGAAGSVGGSASSAVCRAVLLLRISLISSSGVRPRRATTPCSVNRPSSSAHVRGIADLDVVVVVAGEQRLEVAGVRGDGVDVPAGQVGRRVPFVGRDLLQQRREVVDRLPPDVDVTTQLLREHQSWAAA